MRKAGVFLLMVVVGAFMLTPGPANAAPVTFTTDQMATWQEIYQGSLTTVHNYGPGIGVDFVIDYTGASDYNSAGWNDINIGWSWDVSGGWNADYRGYDGYALNIGNYGTDRQLVNLFMNTGFTGSGEADNRYQSDWVWLDPFQDYNFYLPFDDVVNLNHVTAIGIGVGANGPDSGQEGYMSTGGTIGANPVPVPGAVWLMGSGLVGLLGLRKKRS